MLSDGERLAFQQDPCLPGHPDPYPLYAALREEGPVQWSEGPGLWIVLGHPECEAHMRDDRCSRQDHLDKLIQRCWRRAHFPAPKGRPALHGRRGPWAGQAPRDGGLPLDRPRSA